MCVCVGGVSRANHVIMWRNHSKNQVFAKELPTQVVSTSGSGSVGGGEEVKGLLCWAAVSSQTAANSQVAASTGGNSRAVGAPGRSPSTDTPQKCPFTQG